MVDAALEILRISVRPSPETNDHEVCLTTADGDLISRFEEGLIGMDPDDLLVAPCPLRADASPRTTTIGRCTCGIVGCGSVEVTIERAAGVVTWTTQQRPIGVRFDAEQYDAEVMRALGDFSWETPDRTAARLIRLGVDAEALRRQDLQFSWASGRVTARAMTIALVYTPGPYQVLVDVSWSDTEDEPQAVAQRCLDTLATSPEDWPNVRWSPLGEGLDVPKIAGPGWKPIRRG